jgi:hypothetical protein
LEDVLQAAATLVTTATPANATTRDRDTDLAGRWVIGDCLPSTGRTPAQSRPRCPRR